MGEEKELKKEEGEMELRLRQKGEFVLSARRSATGISHTLDYALVS